MKKKKIIRKIIDKYRIFESLVFSQMKLEMEVTRGANVNTNAVFERWLLFRTCRFRQQLNTFVYSIWNYSNSLSLYLSTSTDLKVNEELSLNCVMLHSLHSLQVLQHHIVRKNRAFFSSNQALVVRSYVVSIFKLAEFTLEIFLL